MLWAVVGSTAGVVAAVPDQQQYHGALADQQLIRRNDRPRLLRTRHHLHGQLHWRTFIAKPDGSTGHRQVLVGQHHVIRDDYLKNWRLRSQSEDRHVGPAGSAGNWPVRATWEGRMTAKIVVALITAGASLLVAIFSAVYAKITQMRLAHLNHQFDEDLAHLRNQFDKDLAHLNHQFDEDLSRQKNRFDEDLAHLNHQLEEQRAERNARRDYEYEAKKRLYAECEPILFEAMELAENFQRRVISLARSARRGDLSPDGTGWLSARDYYFKSTVFYILAPVTSFKILQQRLTAIDLSLEPMLEYQYRLLKHIFNSYSWDHGLSREDPTLDYDPDAVRRGNPDRDRMLANSPQRYRRQGLFLGIIDQIADALIATSEGAYHCKSLGTFSLEFDSPRSQLGELTGELNELFEGFHPDLKPVLWRVLVTQYQLFGAFLRTRGLPGGDPPDLQTILPLPDGGEADKLNWLRQDHEAGTSAMACLLIGHSYLLEQLVDLAGPPG